MPSHLKEGNHEYKYKYEGGDDGWMMDDNMTTDNPPNPNPNLYDSTQLRTTYTIHPRGGPTDNKQKIHFIGIVYLKPSIRIHTNRIGNIITTVYTASI